MNLEGMQADRAGHSSTVDVLVNSPRLNPPVFSKLNLSSILRPRRTRKPHHGEDITVMRRAQANPSPRQQPMNQSTVKATSHVRGFRNPIRTPTATDLDDIVDSSIKERIGTPKQTEHLIEEPGRAGEEPNATSPTETGRTRMKIPVSQSAHSGLRFDSTSSTTSTWQPRETSPDPVVWDAKNPNQPESVEQANTIQRRGTATESSQDIEASFNDNLISGTSDPSQVNVERERERAKEESQPEHSEWAKDYVWQILRHNMRGAEGISGSVVVETEPFGTQKLLIVKCYGSAVTRAKEIRKLLEKTKRGLASQGFILSVREETRHGTAFSLLWGPESSDDIGSRSNLSGLPSMAGVSDPPSRQGNTARAARYHEADRFANTPYWNSTSILVDCLFPPRPQLVTNTLCGALVRMMSWEHQGESQLRTWTCGGLIHVNGIPYALTTAHPLILDSRGKEQDDIDTTKPRVIVDVFPEEHPMFPERQLSNGRYETQSWQTLGQVYKHAMSNGDCVPANYDWLLIDIAKDYVLPNFPAGHNRFLDLGEKSGNPESMSICTWRGSLQATLLPGLSFMILGESSFKTMKLSVDQPMGESALTFTVQLCGQVNFVQHKETPDHGSSKVKTRMEL
jgi:hypothetical protein